MDEKITACQKANKQLSLLILSNPESRVKIKQDIEDFITGNDKALSCEMVKLLVVDMLWRNYR